LSKCGFFSTLFGAVSAVHIHVFLYVPARVSLYLSDTFPDGPDVTPDGPDVTPDGPDVTPDGPDVNKIFPRRPIS
jgi:hypothetical protein